MSLSAGSLEEKSQLVDDAASLGQDRHGTQSQSSSTETLPLSSSELQDTHKQILSWQGSPGREREVYCSRSLDMSRVRVIGYDMDYTLVQYYENVWEARAYHHAKQLLREKGFPVDDLQFDEELVCRGLMIDKELGNLIKVDRHGYVRKAMHGLEVMPRAERIDTYGRTLVDLREERYEFLNTLFSCSEACLYAQLVEKFDDGRLVKEAVEPFSPTLVNDYRKLFQAVSKALFKAHVTGELKSEVSANPEKFVRLDPDLPQTLLDQQNSGKNLVLITNSDWHYTDAMMSYICNQFLEPGLIWRDLFDLVIVSSRKPLFFLQANRPIYELADPKEGLQREVFKIQGKGLYTGGSAHMVEKHFACSPHEMLYVGDHIFTDLNQAKSTMRWRTALVVQELEKEILARELEREHHEKLVRLRDGSDRAFTSLNRLRHMTSNRANLTALKDKDAAMKLMGTLQTTADTLHGEFIELIEQNGASMNKHWGYLSRAGFNDKSHFMRQIEKYADIFTSRVSNLLWYTPQHRFRGSRQDVAHDPMYYSRGDSGEA